jgi:predicted RNase H-like HicB family nuclease
MRIRVIIELDKQTNSYSAICPELPGCTSCGDTEKEAIALYFEPDTREINPDAKVFEVAM